MNVPCSNVELWTDRNYKWTGFAFSTSTFNKYVRLYGNRWIII